MPIVNVSGLPVHADVIPGNDPPVVFVAQIGTAGSSWQPIIDRLQSGPTVVTYDRPGIGASPPRPAPNLPLPYSGFAAELAGMLDTLGIVQPVVLAGHSVGSVIVRAFAAAHPSRIAGMVHVDGSVPHLDLGPWVGPHLDGDTPDCTVFDTVRGAAEITGVNWPPVPGVVVVRTPGVWAGDTPYNPNIDRYWHDHAVALARDLRVPRIVAANAGHQIPREAPRLVAYAIDEVVLAVREQRDVAFDPDRVTAVGGDLD